MTCMFDYITDWLGKERIYSSRKRKKHFVVAVMKCCGYHADEFWADVGKFLYLELLLFHTNGVYMAKCDFHGEMFMMIQEELMGLVEIYGPINWLAGTIQIGADRSLIGAV